MKQLKLAILLGAILLAPHAAPAQTQPQPFVTPAGPQILMIYLNVTDVSRSARFYRDVFGFTAGKEFGTVLDIPGAASQRIVLTKVAAPGTPTRFTLVLPNIDAVVARVEPAGGRITQKLFSAADNNRPGVRLGWIADPDGNAIELIQPPPAS
jgi:predicted enzyme related to lactoylglutathione lyase